MSTKRPTKALARPTVQVKPSGFGKPDRNAEAAIRDADQPKRGYRVNGRP